VNSELCQQFFLNFFSLPAEPAKTQITLQRGTRKIAICWWLERGCCYLGPIFDNVAFYL